jgi:hypothetical protein
MNASQEYILTQPENYQSIFKLLRQIILQSAPNIEERIRYGIPFFDYHGWMCYLSPLKKDKGVYIAFLRGFELSNEQGILEANGRTMIKSITYTHVKEIQEAHLREIIQEALLLNEEHYKAKKAKKKK